MAAVRDIIAHVEVQIASARRICHRSRNDHSIAENEKCLTIRDKDGGRKNYCLPCAAEILEKAKLKLQTLEREIRG